MQGGAGEHLGDDLAPKARPPIERVHSYTLPVKQAGWTPYLVFSVATAVVGTSFMNGYHGGVVNAPYDIMSDFVNQSFIDMHDKALSVSEMNTHWSLVVSLFMVGCIIGSIWFPEAIADRVGRKNCLLYTAPIGALGGILCFISPYTNSYLPLYIGRVVLGLQNGVAMVIVSALLVELPPVHLRGACGSFNELTLVIGIAVANLVGLRYLLGTEEFWQFLFVFATILYIIHALLLIFAAESPRWLVDRGREERANKTLAKLRQGADQRAVSAEFQEIKELSVAESAVKTVTLADFFKSRQLFWPLVISINLHFSQELTGIVAVQSYASEVMIIAGLNEDHAKIANFGVSILNVVGTILSTWIVDRVGRRWLMLSSLIGMGMSNIFLTVVLGYDYIYASVGGFAVFLFAFALGAGPIPWFMAAEMFTQAARPPALSICLFANWITKLLVGLAFPHMNHYLREYAFLPFAGFAILEFFFLFFFLPETNGISIEEVVEKFLPGQPYLQVGNTAEKMESTNPTTSSASDLEVDEMIEVAECLGHQKEESSGQQKRSTVV